MKCIYTALSCFPFLFFSQCIKIEKKASASAQVQVQVSSTDIQAGFEYLNKVRANPTAYSSEIGVDLSYVTPIHALFWNDTLAKVATAKATDMAQRDYFAHVDPDGNGINIKINEAGYLLSSSLLTDKSQNNFESLSGGATSPVAAIKDLILDNGINPPGHRNHLLAIDTYWSDCYDIGIGFVQGSSSSSYISYCCVIIAKHH